MKKRAVLAVLIVSSLPALAFAGPGIFAPDQLFITIPQKNAIVVTSGLGLASEAASKATVVWTVTSTPPPGQPFSTMAIENPNQRNITNDELNSASRALSNAVGPMQLQESTTEVMAGRRVGTLRAVIANPSQQILANAVNVTSLLSVPSLRLQLDGIWYSPRSSCPQLDRLARDRAMEQAQADASAIVNTLGFSAQFSNFPLNLQRLTPTLCGDDVPGVTWSLFGRPQAPLGQATRYQTLTEMTQATGGNRTFSGASTDEETAWLNSTQTDVSVEISPGTSTTTAAGDASITIVPDAVLLLGINFGPQQGATPIASGRFAKARFLIHATRSAIDEAAYDMIGSQEIEIVPFARSCAARNTAVQAAVVRAASATSTNARLARRKPGRILFTEIRSVTSDVICGALPASERDALERLDPGVAYESPWARYGFFSADAVVTREMDSEPRESSSTSVAITRDAELRFPAQTATLSIDFSGRGDQTATLADAQPILDILSRNGVAPSSVSMSTRPMIAGQSAGVNIEAYLPTASPSYVRRLGEAITSGEGYPRFHAFSEVIFGVRSCAGIRDRARQAAFDAAIRASRKPVSELQAVNEEKFVISAGRCGNAPNATAVPVARNGEFEQTNGGNVVVKDEIELVYRN